MCWNFCFLSSVFCQKQEIKEAFDLFDTDKNGQIDYHELKVTLSVLYVCVFTIEVWDIGTQSMFYLEIYFLVLLVCLFLFHLYIMYSIVVYYFRL